MKKIHIATVLMFLLVAPSINCSAQEKSKSLLKQVIQENQDAVNAIAMYPTETRKIIFQACLFPEIIAKLSAMQKNSQDSFEKLISSLSKEEQEKIWNITRYDGLIADLVTNQNRSEGEINKILVNYPEEIHSTAFEELKNNYVLLVQIDKMNTSFNSDFKLLLEGYPEEAVSIFSEMMKMPEILSILFDHMQYTVVVGDYYKRNPEKVLHKTDSLNLILTQNNLYETDDWKQGLADDTQAQEEYTQAAMEYAQDNGYQPEDYNAPLTQDVTTYNTMPYNWWFGYPSWYPYDYWYPYPYWYDWGFYYGLHGHIIFFGLPSTYFMEWYFYYPENFYKYPELCNHYYNYYNVHRQSMNSNSISHSMNEWRKRNKDIVTDDWDKDNVNRVQRFKEYGKMEIDRRLYNVQNPQKQMDQINYLQTKKGNYPLISADISKKQLILKDSKTQTVQENAPIPIKKPTVTVPNYYKATDVISQPNKNIKQEPNNANIQPKDPSPVKQTENFNQIRNAQQYHENTWKQLQPPTQQQQQSQPQRQQQQQYNPPPAPRQQENRQIEQAQPIKQNVQPPSNNKKK